MRDPICLEETRAPPTPCMRRYARAFSPTISASIRSRRGTAAPSWRLHPCRNGVPPPSSSPTSSKSWTWSFDLRLIVGGAILRRGDRVVQMRLAMMEAAAAKNEPDVFGVLGMDVRDHLSELEGAEGMVED